VDDINLFQTDEICTHKRPNHIQVVAKNHEFKFEKEEIWRVKFLDNFKAEGS